MSNIEMEYSANTLLKKPHSVIQFDKTTGELKRPTLLLRKKNGEYICKLDYTNLKMSLVGKGLDEISFDVHKYVDGKKFPFWERLTDLKTIEYVGYGCFETSVNINDAEETVKSCVAVSLECELGQLILREGHYNDEEDIINAENNDNDTDNTNVIDNTLDTADSAQKSAPRRTVLFNKEDPKHSLLHRVLNDKAPHWSIGFVSPLLNVDGYVYESNHFQRTYTADGISIYDFLTGEVAAESNCIFLFDTYKRLIHCVNIESCVYDTANMKVVEGAYKKDGQYYDKAGKLLETKTLAYCEGIGEDTNILVSKQKLAQDFGVEFNKDSVKNCFYVTGGDDIINNLVAAANLSGNNYIYDFSKFQCDDMSDSLRGAFEDYKKFVDSERDSFYGPSGVYVLTDSDEYTYMDGVCRDKYQNIITDFIYDDGKLFIKNPYAYKDENGIICNEKDEALPSDGYRYKADGGLYTNYCNLVTRRSYLKDGKFPDTPTRKTTAKDEYEKLLETLFSEDIVVVVTQAISENDYAIALKNAKAYLQAMIDSRYEVILENDALVKEKEGDDYILNATISIVNSTNKNDFYSDLSQARIKIKKIALSVAEQNKYYVKQKLAFKIASLKFPSLDYASIPEDNAEKLEEFFSQYNLTTLKNYVSNFKNCRDVLIDLANGHIHAEGKNANPTCDALYDKYEKYRVAAEKIQNIRINQINQLDSDISTAYDTLEDSRIALKNYIKGKQWEEFWSFVREDEYHNENYISDGLTDSELIEKANALLAAATKELQKACVLQRSVSVNLMNLFAIPEYQPLFHDFEIFNFIRVKVDDEIYKVRIVQLDFDENSPESIQVTFSEDVEYQDGTVSDLQNMRSQIAGIATSYNSTYRQAKQGANAQSTFQKIKEEGLLSSEFLIKNSNSEETVIDNTGILTRSMDDVGCYSDFQCKIIGKGLYLTSDNWKSVKAGIGLMKFNDEWQYGVIADTIVGNLLEGNEVIIHNKDVTINGTGMTLRGGTINWETPIAQKNIENLTPKLNELTTDLQTNASNLNAYKQEIEKFQKKINDSISALDNRIPLIPSTEIGQDYMISPKIGGGYVYIASDNRNYTEIDPNGVHSNNKNIFCVTANGQKVISAKNNFATIAGFTATNNAFYNGCDSLNSDTEGIYVGTNGIKSIGDAKNYTQIKKGIIECRYDNSYSPIQISSKTPSVYYANSNYQYDDNIDYKLTMRGNYFDFSNDKYDGYKIIMGYTDTKTNNADGSEYLNVQTPCIKFTDWSNTTVLTINQNKIDMDNQVILNSTKNGYGIQSSKPIYIDNGKCLESHNYYGEPTHLIGASSGSSTIFIGNHDIHNQDTETICLNATNIYYTGNAPQAISSDRRIKSNISPIENPVELIKNLEPCQYNLADSTSERKHFGFIAQQVNDILSKTTGDAGLFVKMPAEDGVEVDFDNEETYLCGLRYDEFIAPIVATIQDLYKQVDTLKEEIKELKENTISKTK